MTELVIIGAGMSGLCMGIAARRAGIEDFVILEKAPELGGTWWANRYPGAQCDVHSHLYCYSFEPNPDWSRSYADPAEIQRYMLGCAQKYGVLAKIRFNQRVVAAHFDESSLRWRVFLADGKPLDAQLLVASHAPLSEPRWPRIDGLNRFTGKLMHTSRWDPSVDLEGKRIAVIGTAASAVQVVPQAARRAASLTVFQRSPNWIIPRNDHPYSKLQRTLFRFTPLGLMLRWWLFWFHERGRIGFNEGTFTGRFARQLAVKHLERQVSDPALRAKLTPNYPFGCKRVLLSDDYFPTLQRPGVELVTDSIDRIESNRTITRDGRQREFDLLICATGFDTGQMSHLIDFRGESGARLEHAWANGPMAYLGTTVPKMPNFFLMLGPNTGTGHTSTLLYIEAQVRYVMRAWQELKRRGKPALVVSEEATNAHNEALQRRLSISVWGGSCESWYKTAGGRITAIWPGYTLEFWRALRTPNFGDYRFLG